MREKKFHLYFAGSQNPDAERKLQELNVDRLCSQLLDRQIIAQWIDARQRGAAQGNLFIDSGAYSAHTRGIVINVDEYIEYVNDLDEEIYLVAQLDTIPGVYKKKKTREQLENAPAQSWENYLYMRTKMYSPRKLLPIFHQGEDFKWLDNMLNARFDGEPIWYIGLSPANDMPLKEKDKWLERCYSTIRKSSNPDVCTHIFGMTTLSVLERYPATSADSTTWIMQGAMGSIVTKYGSIPVSQGITHASDHLLKMPKAIQKDIQDYVESHGYNLEGLATSYKDRIDFNIMYFNEWTYNYELQSSTITRKRLF